MQINGLQMVGTSPAMTKEKCQHCHQAQAAGQTGGP
jgi:hypothetical protein